MQITLQKINHRDAWQIGIYFAPDNELTKKVKLLQANWSRTCKCWYAGYSKENYKKITELFAGISIKIITQPAANLQRVNNIQPTAAIPTNTLKTHHQKPPIPNRTSNITCQKPPIPTSISNIIDAPSKNIPQKPEIINPCNRAALHTYLQYMTLKRLSPSTIRTYKNEFSAFLQHIKNVAAESFTTDRIKAYLYYCHSILKLSEHTVHSRMNALKLYYEQVLDRQKFFWQIPRPKKPLQLPRIFNQDEVAAIINNTVNKKHKTMLMLSYSAGLRVSETVTLKTSDIDSSRMSIFICQAKGKKDRMVTLSPILLIMLREYASQYKPDKKGYLFEGSTPGTPYSSRSLQEIIQAAKKKAGILKPGSIHSLRHSFATHLIERGTDITMIQKLLGHNDIKTTLRYLHTSNKDLLKIISPLDDLQLG